jgi:gliding motility-associated lipoprotein GldH
VIATEIFSHRGPEGFSSGGRVSGFFTDALVSQHKGHRSTIISNILISALLINFEKKPLKIIKYIGIALCLQMLIVCCTTIDLYEKNVAIPGHAWASSYKPSFDFTIRDSNATYQIFLVLRHNEKYNFNNIYVNVYAKVPGSDSTIKIQKDLTIADNEGWKAATAMDDVYEHRLPLGEIQALKAGNYSFTLEQIMREDPLQNVLNAGLRIEKK